MLPRFVCTGVRVCASQASVSRFAPHSLCFVDFCSMLALEGFHTISRQGNHLSGVCLPANVPAANGKHFRVQQNEGSRASGVSRTCFAWLTPHTLGESFESHLDHHPGAAFGGFQEHVLHQPPWPLRRCPGSSLSPGPALVSASSSGTACRPPHLSGAFAHGQVSAAVVASWRLKLQQL